MSLYKLGDVAAYHRVAGVLRAVQSETALTLHCTQHTILLYDMLPHHLIYITM